MQARQFILGIAVIFTAVLTYMTIRVTIEEGPTILTALSLLVLALFGFGVVGALRHPPDE